jgi:hypothetical protein
MPKEPVCQVERSWLDVGSFHTRLIVGFINFTASVQNILDTLSYLRGEFVLHFCSSAVMGRNLGF